MLNIKPCLLIFFIGCCSINKVYAQASMDVNGDGIVSWGDHVALGIRIANSTAVPVVNYDYDGDFDVDAQDLSLIQTALIWHNNFTSLGNPRITVNREATCSGESDGKIKFECNVYSSRYGFSILDHTGAFYSNGTITSNTNWFFVEGLKAGTYTFRLWYKGVNTVGCGYVWSSRFTITNLGAISASSFTIGKLADSYGGYPRLRCWAAFTVVGSKHLGRNVSVMQTLTINWGDGTSSTGDKDDIFQHLYASAGTYCVTATFTETSFLCTPQIVKTNSVTQNIAVP